MIHDRHRAAHLVVAIRGEEFPNCRKCRATVRYELVQASEYVVDDWDLSGPALRLLNFNYMPMPFNAYLAKSPSPENLIYSDPKLAPGGTGGRVPPAEIPPAVSAYTVTGYLRAV